jgi:hypothetical protein
VSVRRYAGPHDLGIARAVARAKQTNSSDRWFAVAKVRIVVEVLLTRMPLRADRGAGVAGALGSFGAGIRINELREVVVPSRTVTWQTKV